MKKSSKEVLKGHFSTHELMMMATLMAVLSGGCNEVRGKVENTVRWGHHIISGIDSVTDCSDPVTKTKEFSPSQQVSTTCNTGYGRVRVTSDIDDSTCKKDAGCGHFLIEALDTYYHNWVSCGYKKDGFFVMQNPGHLERGCSEAVKNPDDFECHLSNELSTTYPIISRREAELILSDIRKLHQKALEQSGLSR